MEIILVVGVGIVSKEKARNTQTRVVAAALRRRVRSKAMLRCAAPPGYVEMCCSACC